MLGQRRSSCTPESPCSVHAYGYAFLCFCEKCRAEPNRGYRIWDKTQGSWDSHLRHVPLDQMISVPSKYFSCTLRGRLALEENVHVMCTELEELVAGLEVWARAFGMRTTDAAAEEAEEGNGTSQKFLIATALVKAQSTLAHLLNFSASQEPTSATETMCERLGYSPPRE